MARSLRSRAADAIRATRRKEVQGEPDSHPADLAGSAVKISGLHFQVDSEMERYVEDERSKVGITLGFDKTPFDKTS